MRSRFLFIISMLLVGCSSPKYYQFHSTNPYAYSQQQPAHARESGPAAELEISSENLAAALPDQNKEVGIAGRVVLNTGKESLDQEKSQLQMKSQTDTVKNKTAATQSLKSTNSKASFFSAIGAYALAIILAAANATSPVFFVFYAGACIAAIVFGAVAMKRHEKKRWMAITGLIMGGVGLIVPLVFAIIFILFLDALFHQI